MGRANSPSPQRTTFGEFPHWTSAGAAWKAVAILLASFALAAFVVSHRPWVEQARSSSSVPLLCRSRSWCLRSSRRRRFSVTDALAIMNGVLFGPVAGSIVNAIGLVLAAMIGYAVALRTSTAFDVRANVERFAELAPGTSGSARRCS